ncbi:SAM-dependent methyltransferase [Kitasatospora sp. NA04385]|uniref:SAM-dependent methyltransferase n=1 Tax=Kitasatospora sp. NA04385 TaxID=2742135 RepID=UPI001591E84A|nr:SAM-dependent methyltransferase [Kitasatospora sp. NA04385]QKW20660.1 SAM-dependent methyltransferase [Kitasatospora sp. NA04385]
MADASAQADDVEVKLDIHRPHSARMYDFYLGGTTNFPADREAAGQALAVFPFARSAARANRAFMRRSTRILARSGIRQFLDVGTGIPTSPNLHEVAQQVAPDAAVVYADNDPIVLLHAKALLHGTEQGVTSYVQADVRDPAFLLEAAARTLDFSRPIALSMNALLHFVPDEARQIAEGFKAELPSGSALVISHLTQDFAPEETARVIQVYTAAGTPVVARTRAEFAEFFTGWDLLEPGVAATPRWNPESDTDIEPVTDIEASCYGAVAIRP